MLAQRGRSRQRDGFSGGASGAEIGSIVECHALMSCWDFLGGRASQEAPTSRRQHRQHHQHCRRRLGHGSRAAAGRTPVRADQVYVADVHDAVAVGIALRSAGAPVRGQAVDVEDIDRAVEIDVAVDRRLIALAVNRPTALTSF